MKRSPYFSIKAVLLAVAIIPLAAFSEPAQEQVSAPAAPPVSEKWTMEDYGLHDPDTFRLHAPARQTIPPESADMELLAATVFYASNRQRQLNGLPPFSYSAALCRSAAVHSRAMGIGGFFAHNNPYEPHRRTPWQRMNAEGVVGGFRAENIASLTARSHSYLSAADSIVAMWMKSPGHRKNLLSPRLRFLGCGIHISRQSRSQVLATQNFASKVPEQKPAS